MKDWFTFEIQYTLRRNLGIPSPMNVWKRQFTQLSFWEYIRLEAMQDYEFLFSDKWPEVGSTVNIRKPQRFHLTTS